ncbi:MAG: hypothetical protein PHS59_14930 [Paludibacter sp.]|nr:hypothetical protein [Paludibacter sp.]
MIKILSNRMMTKKGLIFLLIITLVGVFVYFQYYKNNVNKLLNYYDITIEKYSAQNTNLNVIKSEFKSYMYSEYFPIDSNMVLTSDKGKKIMLKNIVKNGARLIVRFSYLNCEACVESQIKIINEFSHNFKAENVIFIASYDNLRNLKMFNMTNKTKYAIYNVEGDILKQIDERNEPHFFILDNSMRARFVFIPHKELPELTKVYLKALCDRYFPAGVYL